ncbi:MAG: hypothetical protein CMB34_04980 [Euryarchaeota archaeon]|nr:hypothetical protein [Euryarchaeota archaeon]
MGRNVVEALEVGHHFGHLDGRKFAHLKFHAEASVFTLCVVEDVHAKFSGHVKTVVGAYVDAHLAGRACFPNHADASVVVAGHEKPWLHVLETLVRVLDGLGFPQRGLQIRSHPVRSKLLTTDVVHRRR